MIIILNFVNCQYYNMNALNLINSDSTFWINAGAAIGIISGFLGYIIGCKTYRYNLRIEQI